jgi:hypothetical protein
MLMMICMKANGKKVCITVRVHENTQAADSTKENGRKI